MENWTIEEIELYFAQGYITVINGGEFELRKEEPSHDGD